MNRFIKIIALSSVTIGFGSCDAINDVDAASVFIAGSLEDDIGGGGAAAVATAVGLVLVVAFDDFFDDFETLATKPSGTSCGKRRQNLTLLSNRSSTVLCTLDPRWGFLVLASAVYPAVAMVCVKIPFGVVPSLMWLLG